MGRMRRVRGGQRGEVGQANPSRTRGTARRRAGRTPALPQRLGRRTHPRGAVVGRPQALWASTVTASTRPPPGAQEEADMQSLIDNARSFHELAARNAGAFEGLADGQSPQALFIACSDSRVIPAAITGARPGELFE